MVISETVGGPSAVSYSQMAVPGPHLHRHGSRTSRSQLQIGKFRLSTALPGATVSGACLSGFSSHLGTVELTFASGDRQHATRGERGTWSLSVNHRLVTCLEYSSPESQKPKAASLPKSQRATLAALFKPACRFLGWPHQMLSPYPDV